MTNPFYKLQQSEVVELATVLRYTEFKILLYLKTANPFEDGQIKVKCGDIAELFGMNPRTVSRALKKLESLALIGEVIITEALVTVAPRKCLRDGSTDPSDGRTDPLEGSTDPLEGSTDPRRFSKTSKNQAFRAVTTADQIDQTLRSSSDQPMEEEEEETLTFKALPAEYRKFLQAKGRGLPIRPNNMHGWVVAMARKKTYLSEFEQLQEAKKVAATAEPAPNFESQEDYVRWMKANGRY